MLSCFLAARPDLENAYIFRSTTAQNSRQLTTCSAGEFHVFDSGYFEFFATVLFMIH
jgi:hypothetical protein